MRKTFLLKIILLFAQSLWAQIPASPSQDRSGRVEEILVWKISEELKLAPKEEKKISEMIRNLNIEKSEKALVIENLQQKMSGELSAKDSKSILAQYKKALADYNQLSIDEIQRVQKILSLPQSVRYFSVKAGLSNKIRAILGYNSRNEHHTSSDVPAVNAEKAAPLPEPKIIEDPN